MENVAGQQSSEYMFSTKLEGANTVTLREVDSEFFNLLNKYGLEEYYLSLTNAKINIDCFKTMTEADIKEIFNDEIGTRIKFRGLVNEWRLANQLAPIATCCCKHSDQSSASGSISQSDSISSFSESGSSTYRFSLHNFLDSAIGIKICSNYIANNELGASDREILISNIVRDHLEKDVPMNYAMFDNITEDIVKRFASEKKEYYFQKEKRNGKLYNKYRNMSTAFRKSGFFKKYLRGRTNNKLNSIQESLAEVTVQTNKPEAAQSSAADHLQDDIKLIEQCIDAQGEFEGFIKNEPIEDDEEANSEYSDVNTMHSTISVTHDEPKELEDQQVNVTSSRHNCHLCNKSYKRREYLRRHLNNHRKKATNLKEYCYACSLCGESYKEQRFLSRHLNLEHYNSKSNASSEKTVHEGAAKPRECDICGKKFRLNAGLTIHKRIHSTEKPHKCDLCEKQFVQFHDLKMHIHKYIGEKPYKCKYCECAFTTGSARMKHLRCHLGDNIYRCTFCPLNFPLESEKRLHLTTHQNEDLETRERNLKALQEEEAKLVLKFSKEKGEVQSTEEQQQQKLSNKEIKQPTTERDEFKESTNVSIEDDKSNTEYSDGNTIHSTISATKDETSPIEPEYQQVNATRDEFGVFVINEPIEDNNPSTGYSGGDTMHSIISIMKDEPKEPEYEQVNDAPAGEELIPANKKKLSKTIDSLPTL